MKLADDDNAAVTQVLADYYHAFSTLDAQAVLPYFHEPSPLVSPAGVVPTPTPAAVAAAFQHCKGQVRDSNPPPFPNRPTPAADGPARSA